MKVQYRQAATPAPTVEVPEFCKVDDPTFTLEDIYRIDRRGILPGDQLFTTSLGGSYNASLFKRLWESFPEHFNIRTAPLSDSLFEYIVRNIEINKQHMLALTAEQLIEPVRVVTLNDAEPFYIIDGHHRIVRLYLEGYRQFYAVTADRFMSHRCHVARAKG